MALVENVMAGWIVAFAVLLTALAVGAYRRSSNPKVLGIAAAFALFAGKGAVVSWALFTSVQLEEVWVEMAAFDTAILLVFYLSALR